MTWTDIANLALAKLGETAIASIEDPNAKGARVARLHYETVRDELLRAAFWSFARVVAVPEAVTVDEEDDAAVALLAARLDGWEYAFPLPADFVKLDQITADGVKVDRFAIRRVGEVRCVLVNAEEIRLHYVARIEEVEEYDPLFRTALVTLLASRMARQMTGSEALEGELLQRYEQVDLPAARTADAQETESNENHPLQEILDGTLTGGRGGYFGHGVIAEIEE